MAVALIVEFNLRSGTGPAFVKRLQRHAATCLDKEVGCHQFDILVPQDDSDTAWAYEVYEDDAALEIHWASDHMQAYRADVGDIVAERRVTRSNLVES